MDLVGSWSLPTAVSVDETCILGVSQEGEKKSYPLLLKVFFKAAQVLAVHFWMIKMYMENIFNAIYHECCFACLWMHQCKFGFQWKNFAFTLHSTDSWTWDAEAMSMFSFLHILACFFFCLILPSWKIPVGDKIKKKHLWLFVRQGKVLWLSPIGLIKSGSEKSRQLKFPAGEAISFTNGDVLSQR